MEGKSPQKRRPSWWRQGDHVMVAWAEPCNGPGWANSPVLVLVFNATARDTRRVEYLQPEDQTPEMHILYGVSHAASAAMTNAVRKHLL